MSDPIQLLETQAAATRGTVESVADAHFTKALPGCPGWKVQDAVAHLTTGAQMLKGYALDTISGADWMEERAKRLAQNLALTPADLKRRYAETDTELVETFKSLSPQQLQAKRHHAVFVEVPVELFLGLRIAETAIHGWDIHSAFDAGARLQAPATAAVAARMTTIFPTWFLADKIASLDRSYRFIVGQPVNDDRTLSIADGKAFWGSDTTSPDATLTLDGGDFLLLISGRLSSEQLISSGRAQASGDLATANELSTLFKAFDGR